MFNSLLLQAGAAQGQAAQGGLLMSVLPFLLIIIIFYFFIIRPQNKKQKETQKMIDALKKGDKVITIGGIHGVVSSTKEKTVIVKVDGGTTIEFNRTAISTVLNPQAPAGTSKADKKAEKAKAEKNAEATEEAKTEPENAPAENASVENAETATTEA